MKADFSHRPVLPELKMNCRMPWKTKKAIPKNGLKISINYLINERLQQEQQQQNQQEQQQQSQQLEQHQQAAFQ